MDSRTTETLTVAEAWIRREVNSAPYLIPELRPFGRRWMIRAAAPTSRHGDLAYLTHAVADTARIRAFYGAVLGWTLRPGRVEDGW